jgi:hypothetical protein
MKIRKVSTWLIAMAAVLCAAPAIAGPGDAFAGYWWNENNDSGNLWHVTIVSYSGGTGAQAFGECAALPGCDWGTVSAKISGSTLTANFPTKAGTATVTLTVINPQMLAYDVKRAYMGKNLEYTGKLALQSPSYLPPQPKYK